MDTATIAQVVENRPGTLASNFGAYGGVADRDLTILHMKEGILQVRDNGLATADPVSTDLLPGIHYLMLFRCIPEGKIEYFTAPKLPPSEPYLWQGQIIDPIWRAPQQPYFCSVSNMHDIAGILITSPIGLVLIPKKYVDISVQAGAFMRWEFGQIDLMAVYEAEQTAIGVARPAVFPRQMWQREPEIALTRQSLLRDRCQIIPDITLGIYPFSGMVLSRADIEWLLLTHESAGLFGKATGPIDWSDELSRDRPGLDLRGADLRSVNLSGLPLTRMIGGLRGDSWLAATPEQRQIAAIHLEHANLSQTHLEGALLRDAHLEDAYLDNTYLNNALLRGAHLNRVQGPKAQFRQAFLSGASLTEANLTEAHMEHSDLILADFSKAILLHSFLEMANAQGANFDNVDFSNAHLERAFFYHAHFKDVNLTHTDLTGIDLSITER